MKRVTLMAAVAGAAVLLVGCSSTSGTATTAGTVSSVGSSSVAASQPATSPASSPGTPSAPASSPAAAGVASSAAPGSPAASVGTAGSTPAVAEAPTVSPVVTSSVTRPAPTTVGGTSRALDAQSTAWFTAFCGGMSPVLELSQSVGSAGTGSAAAQKKVVTLFGTLGSSLTRTAATLKSLPPPTFTGGPAFATKVITAFGASGPAITNEAKKIAADPSSLTSSMGGLTDSLTTAVQPLEELGTLKLTPQTQAAIEALPACAKVQSLAGG